MAIEQLHQQNQSFLSDDVFHCDEKWCEFEEEEDNYNKSCIFPLVSFEQDLFWENEELISLLNKEKETHYCSSNSNNNNNDIEKNRFLNEARKNGVAWIFKVNNHYGFSALTAILAINYLDRFLCNLDYQEDKPWMIHLAAVTCLSLAAKVEETQFFLPLNLQVEDAKYAFDAKTIQKMELLVLSTLKWRMNLVTPFSFIDHIIRRFGLKNHLHWEFLKRCESLVLSIVADCRYVDYLPSVLASATMLHVIHHQVEPCNAIHYQNQLLDVLNITKEKVDSCYDLISEILNASSNAQNNSHKRKYNQFTPSSPSGVIDTLFCSHNSNQPLFKKRCDCPR